MCTCSYTRTHVYAHTHIYTSKHICMHTFGHTHTPMHMQRVMSAGNGRNHEASTAALCSSVRAEPPAAITVLLSVTFGVFVFCVLHMWELFCIMIHFMSFPEGGGICLSLYRKFLRLTLSGLYLEVFLMPWGSLSTDK